jgi:hypothetical protein
MIRRETKLNSPEADRWALTVSYSLGMTVSMYSRHRQYQPVLRSRIILMWPWIRFRVGYMMRLRIWLRPFFLGVYSANFKKLYIFRRLRDPNNRNDATICDSDPATLVPANMLFSVIVVYCKQNGLFYIYLTVGWVDFFTFSTSVLL